MRSTALPHGAPLGVVETPGDARERQAKSLAVLAQPVDGGVERLSVFRDEPCPEGQKPARRAVGVGEQRRGADIGIALGRGPDDEGLRLAGEKGAGAIESGAEIL
ncbi:hypothetical protein WOA01_20260 [Methylocystis sp. IM2]|uniref:hypothetical protein n=1 Tax=Methylocystis sp. IM2 TaxID=3136563 RepID=UPI0030FA8DA3